jgi:glycine/D-amino acid oxidase-like deaminating enzyme
MVLRKVVTSSPPEPQEAHSTTINNAEDKYDPQHFLPVPNPMPSYWLSQPHPHATLRTTPHLSPTCDIAIIGSGMAGILTLYHILQTSHRAYLTTGTRMPRVVLIDARDLCSGATARNGGHAKVKTATLAGLKTAEERNALADYVQRTIYELKRLVEEEGLVEECEFELRRSFDVFQNEEEFGRVKGAYDEGVREGEAWTKGRSVMGAEHVQQVTSIKGAVGAFTSEVASFWPYKLVTGILGVLIQRYGGEEGDADAVLNVQMNTPVTHLSYSSSPSPFQSIHTPGTATNTTTLHTPRGPLDTQKLVLATNAHTASLLPSFSRTIIPCKGMNSHHTPRHPIHPHLTHTYNIHFAPPTSPTTTTPTTACPPSVDYLNPRPDSTIVVGGGSSHFAHNRKTWYNNTDDSLATGHFPGHAYTHWTNYMPRHFLGWSSSNAIPDSIWTGIMGVTVDGMPHIGRVPGVRGQQTWMLAGFNGGGMALIPIVARAVAEMVGRDVGFEDVEKEFGLLPGFGTGEARMGGMAVE